MTIMIAREKKSYRLYIRGRIGWTSRRRIGWEYCRKSISSRGVIVYRLSRLSRLCRRIMINNSTINGLNKRLKLK